MPGHVRRITRTRAARRLTPLAAVVLLLLPGLPARAADPTPPAAATELEATSIHHREAADHGADVIAFTPGERVEVPFRPRAGDRWTVGGVAPRPLPAGRASGEHMVRSPQGSQWTPLAAEPVPAGPARTPATADIAAIHNDAGLFREVFGFLPYWELNDSALDLDLRVLSTIAYFSVGADANGNLQKQTSSGTPTTGWAGWTSSRMTRVIEDAHRSGVRVVLTVTAFAWTSSEAERQAQLLGSASARANLARQVAAAVRDRGADGVNLDFEPIASGHGANFTALVRSVRAELDAIAPGYQLTFDTTGWIGNYPVEDATAPGGADAIFIMGYDYRNGGATTTGSIAPLRGTSYDLEDTVAAYLARVPASKLILGVPYYGRIWSTETDQPGARNVSDARTGESATPVYAGLVNTVAEHGRRWHEAEVSPWSAYQREHCTTTWGCVTSWRQLWYDDAESLGRKYELVNDRGLRGAGMWALGYDNGRTELDAALSRHFLEDLTPPVAGIRFIPWRQRDEGFVVGWSGSDPSGIASWDVQVSRAGGAWQPWLTGTTALNAVYPGEHGIGYAFRVRATDRKGNTGAWDVTETWRAAPVIEVGGFAGVATDGLSMRAAPSTTASRLGTLAKGEILSVVGGPVTAGGYRWWEVVGPLREWRPVSTVSRFWVAEGTAGDPWLVASRVLSSTIVDAVLRGPALGTGAAGNAFSPNADGRHDTADLTWTNGTSLDALELLVHAADGRRLGRLPLPQLAAGAQSVAWDGRLGGERLPDGRYVLSLAGSAGGVAVSAPSSRPVEDGLGDRFGVTLDTTPPTLGRSASTTARISPNGDGRFDEVRVSIASDAVAWTVTVTGLDGPAAGQLVRTADAADGAWTWDGRADDGSVVPDGRYRIAIWSWDAAGNGVPRTWSIGVDATPPIAGLAVAPAIISPDGDGVADTALIGWTTDGAHDVTLEAVAADGGPIASWTVAPAGDLRWDGRDNAGRAVPDGWVTLRLRAVDDTGNETVEETRLLLDRTLARVTWGPALFHPHDRDALAPTSTTSFDLAVPARTTVRILGQDYRYIRTAWVDRALPAGTHRWTWDGRAGSGHLVPPGWYRVVVSATSATGVSQQTRLVLVDAFTVTPSTVTPAVGDTLVVALRTAEPLAAAPTVLFRQPGQAAVLRTATATRRDHWTVSFPVRPGTGPASLTITGTDVHGGTNRQVVPLTVR